MDLRSTRVKAPIYRNSDILIASKCLPVVAPEIFKEISKDKVVVFMCPEQENPAVYGKIASVIRSSRPKSITVVTIDGSPHCFTLHAAVNEAFYILGEKLVERHHYVVVDGEKLVEITPDAVRLARYLSIMQRIVEEHPEYLEELKKHSLEYKLAKERHTDR